MEVQDQTGGWHMPTPEFQPQDTCSRCGLRRATKALEEQGTKIRLCDDCYWGEETQPPTKSDNPPAA
jgi:hypothetical protein